jgi:antirestriction protein ArdC
MHDFILDDYYEELWVYDAHWRRKAHWRGFVFSAEELAGILPLWAKATHGVALHRVDRLRLALRAGGNVEITPDRITLDVAVPPPEAFRAAISHIATYWHSKAVIPLDHTTEHEFRLTARAYAEVYGIELRDRNDVQAGAACDDFHTLSPESALTRAELACLPALRQVIRQTHNDAPPSVKTDS